ncbi:pentapeptide repeat-containing protein [Nakamurella sp. GG22]
MPPPEPDLRRNLLADCSSCFGLCCVALPFQASADFAFDKDAGEPCRHLASKDFGCTIHDRLRERGLPGCTVFDCFGAGQQVSQVTFAGVDWRSAPGTASRMFAVLPVMRQLHELLWVLTEALSRASGDELHAELTAARDRVRQLTAADPDQLLQLDVADQRRRVAPLLQRVSESERAPFRSSTAGLDHRNADLIGAKLAAADLRGADLRGAYLIGADLRRADLSHADLLGADLRAADLRGARLAASLFVTQPQINGARGDRRTTIPDVLAAPESWRRS